MISHEPITWEGDEAERWAKVKPEPHVSIARLPPDYELLCDKADLVEGCQAGYRIWRVAPADTEEGDEFAVLEVPNAPGGCIVYARHRKRWYCNPWSTRALVMALIKDAEGDGQKVPTEPGWWWQLLRGNTQWEPTRVISDRGQLRARVNGGDATMEAHERRGTRWGGRCLGMPTEGAK